MITAKALNGKTYALNCLKNEDGSITEYPTIQDALDALAERDKENAKYRIQNEVL